MRRRLRKGQDSADVNMTPMLDIVFILLIFFIVTATFLQEKGMVMTPPPPDDDSEVPNKPAPTILIQVDENDRIFIERQISDIERVTANVQRFIVDKGGQAAVVIAPHPDSTHGVISRVFDFSQLAEPVGVVVRDPAESA